jgi:hypothetical protein
VLLVRAWPWEITSEPTAAIISVKKGPRWWLGGGVVIECSMKRAASVPRQLRYFFPQDPEGYRKVLLESVEAARQRTAP